MLREYAFVLEGGGRPRFEGFTCWAKSIDDAYRAAWAAYPARWAVQVTKTGRTRPAEG